MSHRPRISPEALVALRLRARLSPMELARATGVSMQTICALERGAHQLPRMATFRALADFFGVPYTELVAPPETAPERADADREEVA